MNSDANWASLAQHFQQDLARQWTQAVQSMQQAAAGAGAQGAPAALAPVRLTPEKVQALQETYVREAAKAATGLCDQALPAKRLSAGGCSPLFHR
ncbi:MAG: hypothetical protein EOO24_62850, partial [Comamonadaceae bacterium]